MLVDREEDSIIFSVCVARSLTHTSSSSCAMLNPNQTNWITYYDDQDNGFDPENKMSEYLAALYWSIQTMTTVGYGDLIPKNDAERAYSIFSMVLGGGYYGFIVATMASLVSNLDANAKSYYEKMDNVTSYMKKRKFPKFLFRKMRKYYKHFFEQKTALNESEILLDLSSQLRTEVALFLIHDIVYNIQLFTELNPEMLAKLLTVLKPLQVQTGDVLCTAGEIGREMYIVISGEMTEIKPSLGEGEPVSEASRYTFSRVLRQLLFDKIARS